jgi:hypothetical protein
VDPVPDPLLFFFSGSAGNRTWSSGSVAKTIIILECYKAINIMFYEEYERGNNNSRHMRWATSENYHKEVHFWSSNWFESTVFTGRAQLLAFSRLVCSAGVIEQFFCFTNNAQKQQIASRVVGSLSHFSCQDFLWRSCISILMHVSPSVLGGMTALVAVTKQNNLDLLWIRRLLFYTGFGKLTSFFIWIYPYKKEVSLPHPV